MTTTAAATIVDVPNTLDWHTDWTSVKRFAEYAGFQLAMRIFISSCVWEIVETRRWREHFRRQRQYERAELAFKLMRWYEHEHRDWSHFERLDAVGKRMQRSVMEVAQALEDARMMGVAEVA